MSDLTTVQISKDASAKLTHVANHFMRSKTKQVEHWINQAYQVVSVETLPHPPDAEPVPVVTVKVCDEVG